MGLCGQQPGEMRGPFVRTWVMGTSTVQNFSVTLKNHVGALLHNQQLDSILPSLNLRL